MDSGSGRGRDDTVAVDRVDVLEGGRLDEKQGGSVIGRGVSGQCRILEGESGGKIGERVGAVVIRDLEAGIEADAFKRELLLDDNLHVGAKALLLLLTEDHRGPEQQRQQDHGGARPGIRTDRRLD